MNKPMAQIIKDALEEDGDLYDMTRSSDINALSEHLASQLAAAGYGSAP